MFMKRKATWELHKNATSHIEQTLEAIPYETSVVRPFTPPPISKTSNANKTFGTLLEKQGRASMDPTHGRASVGRSTRTYLHQLCSDIGCSLENFPGAMNYKNEWRERDRVSTTWL